MPEAWGRSLLGRGGRFFFFLFLAGYRLDQPDCFSRLLA